MSVGTLKDADFAEWSEVWRQYLEFYETTLPATQHKNTFARILDPSGDLEALVIRDPESNKILGLSHYLFHQSSWTDKPVCYLNDLFVDPSTRGKGYGKELILATANAAEQKGCGRLYWSTKEDNATARKLYDSVAKFEFVQYRMPLKTDKTC